MTELFLDILSLSLSASWLVAALMVLRLVLPKAPKAMYVALWGLVALRLILPVSLESSLSLVPEEIGSGAVVENWSQLPVEDQEPAIPAEPVQIPSTDISDLAEPGEVLSPPSDLYSAVPAQPTVEQVLVPGLAMVWAVGMGLLLAYALASHLILAWQVRDALVLEGNVYRSAFAPTAFVLGWLRPRIYVPSTMRDADLAYVIAHERAHVARLDHWWKPLGFCLLAVHWFNPLMWGAYLLLCRDIELACDENVIRSLPWDRLADYSQTLLNCSIHRNMILACPTAFGMTGTKERVKNVLNYKKPKLWICLAMVLAMVVSLVCFFAVPPAQAEEADPTEEPTTQPTAEPLPTLPGNMVPVVNHGIPHTGSILEGQAEDENGVYDYAVTIHTVTPTSAYVYLQTTEARGYDPCSVYRIEQLTDNGWEALTPRAQEAQVHVMEHRSSTFNEPVNLPLSWLGARLDWEAIYGVLGPGTYRLCATLLPEMGEIKMQFTIGDPGKSEAAQALLRYYDALDDLLAQENYHIKTCSHSDGFVYEYRRSGEDYLVYGWNDPEGPMVKAWMLRDGVEYRGEDEILGQYSSIIGWRQERYISMDWFTRWTENYKLTMDQIDAFEETADSVAFRVTGGHILEAQYDANGALTRIEYHYNASGETYAYTLEVLDSTPESIRSEIYGRNVEFYRSLEYAAALGDTEHLVEREFVNTEPVTIENVTQAIARALQETTIYYSTIQVNFDDDRGIWRIDFADDHGKGLDGTESIYMDENGVTLKITRWDPKD